jgi:hypothetical protein
VRMYVIFYRCHGDVNGFLALRDNVMNVCRYNRCHGIAVNGFLALRDNVC